MYIYFFGLITKTSVFGNKYSTKLKSRFTMNPDFYTRISNQTVESCLIIAMTWLERQLVWSQILLGDSPASKQLYARLPRLRDFFLKSVERNTVIRFCLKSFKRRDQTVYFFVYMFSILGLLESNLHDFASAELQQHFSCRKSYYDNDFWKWYACEFLETPSKLIIPKRKEVQKFKKMLSR